MLVVSRNALGFILSRSAANQLHPRHLSCSDFQLYGIIGAAMAPQAPGLWWLKRRGTTIWRATTSGANPVIIAGTSFADSRRRMVIAGMCPGQCSSISAKAAPAAGGARRPLRGRSVGWLVQTAEPLGLPPISGGRGPLQACSSVRASCCASPTSSRATWIRRELAGKAARGYTHTKNVPWLERADPLT